VKFKLPENTVFVYGWYGIIPCSVFDEFEKETGIKVIYDIYDNNDTLEAKLLATNSGYDVVFPSFIPYASRQMVMGVYTKFDLTLLPNLRYIDGIITDKYNQNGGDLNRLIPLFWGTTGIVYEKSVVKKVLPDEVIDSYEVLFNPEKLQKLFPFGVSFPEEYIDIFPQVHSFLNERSKLGTVKNIDKYCRLLSKIRKYITKFSSSTVIADILSGDISIAIGSSDNCWRAQQVARKIGKEVVYTLPTDAGVLWLDCVGIPKGSLNIENAHKLINYLLSPPVAAIIANHAGVLVNVPEAMKYLRKEIVSDKQICPSDPQVLQKLILGHASRNSESIKFEKCATRAWSMVKMNSYSSDRALSK
jgi:putrescine transport system substrate-binding protein